MATMENLNGKQLNELMHIVRETSSTTITIHDHLDHMCACNTQEELDQHYLAIMLRANELYKLGQHRLHVKAHPDFDTPLKTE